MCPGDRNVEHRQSGFTYVAMLFALVIFGIGLAAIGESWSAASRREKEEELISIGSAYAHAIAAYYVQSPGTPKSYPQHLEDLLEDKRFVGVVRHLRKVYRDPLTRDGKWGVVRASDGGIMGVYSLSEMEVLRKRPLTSVNGVMITGTRYSDWKFVYKEKQ
ncbi:type II secretion system protein [Undibacterium sp. LX15W]|uniref:Type II secretion system protein n=2 Tax=Undibacterium flavidum TaxID=2762297 RepID=A0ABR6YB20_9BURK|nr:type II secretion system protein [Undibacterium flavidum]